MAKKVHIAFVAVPGRGLIRSRCPIAFSPIGVAALPKPSMLAAMFMTMAPMAGCSGGTSGKRNRMMGRKARARTLTSPERSARRMTPIQTASVPTKGRTTSTTADFAPSSAPLVTSGRCPFQAPMPTETRINASQMLLSIA